MGSILKLFVTHNLQVSMPKTALPPVGVLEENRSGWIWDDAFEDLEGEFNPLDSSEISSGSE